MGFKLSALDNKLIKFSDDFKERFMSLDVSISLEDALTLCWTTLKENFSVEEVGVKKAFADKYWPKD